MAKTFQERLNALQLQPDEMPTFQERLDALQLTGEPVDERGFLYKTLAGEVPFEPVDGEGILGLLGANVENTGRAVGNIPANIVHMLKGLGDVAKQSATQPLTAKDIGQGFLDAPENALNMIRSSVESLSPTNIVRRPVDAFANAAVGTGLGAQALSKAPALAPKAGLLKGLAERSAQVDPLVAGVRGIKAGAQGVGQGLGASANAALGVMTSKGAPTFANLTRGARRGEAGTGMKAVFDRPGFGTEELGESLSKGMDARQSTLGGNKGAIIDEFGSDLIDTSTLFEDAADRLSVLNINATRTADRLVFPITIKAKAQTAIQEAMDIIKSLGDETTVQSLDEAKQAIGDSFGKAGGNNRLKKALGDINNQIGNLLDPVEGLTEANKAFSEHLKLRRKGQKAASIPSEKTPERGIKAGEGAINTMRPGKEAQRNILKRMEDATGLPLSTHAAGQRASEFAPDFLRSALGVGVGAGVGSASGSMMAGIATALLFSPQVAGTLAITAGVTRRVAEQAINALQKRIQSVLPSNALQTLTVSEALARLENSRQNRDPSNLLSGLGRAAGLSQPSQ